MGRPNPVHRPPEIPRSRSDSDNIDVLVISSNPDLGFFITASLRRMGIGGLKIESGIGKDGIATNGRVKIIFFDTGSMVDSEEVAADIRAVRFAFNSKLACIVPPSRPDAKLLCLAAGADVVLEKPIHSKDLSLQASKVLFPCEHKTSFGGS